MGKQAANGTYHLIWGKFREHKLAMFGLTVLFIEVLAVLILPIFLPFSPNKSDPQAILQHPTSIHLLGTDGLGRDMLARLLSGGRISLFIGVVSTMVGILIGVPLGLIAGYFRGKAETLIMRTLDVFMAFPSLILVLVLVSVVGSSIWSVTAVIGALSWTRFARLIYGNVIAEREKPYIKSAYAIGTTHFNTIMKYVLPNTIAPILIAMTFNTASAILTESSLSFLGMGVQPPQASWGNLLYNAQSIAIFTKNPWVWLPPGIALILTTLSINFFGDGLRDALDPRTM